MVTGAAIVGGVVLDPAVHLDHRHLVDPLRVSGSLLAGVVFVYLMRGVEWVERMRSEAVFGLGHRRSATADSRLTPASRDGPHQLWLDISSARFWKGTAHHYLRMSVRHAGHRCRVRPAGRSRAWDPAAAIAIRQSDGDAGLSFVSPPLAWLLAAVAVVAAVAILVFAPALDAAIDQVAAVAVVDGRTAIPGQRPRRRSSRVRCPRRRTSVTASSATCTTACSRDWCRWP